MVFCGWAGTKFKLEEVTCRSFNASALLPNPDTRDGTTPQAKKLFWCHGISSVLIQATLPTSASGQSSGVYSPGLVVDIVCSAVQASVLYAVLDAYTSWLKKQHSEVTAPASSDADSLVHCYTAKDTDPIGTSGIFGITLKTLSEKTGLHVRSELEPVLVSLMLSPDSPMNPPSALSVRHLAGSTGLLQICTQSLPENSNSYDQSCYDPTLHPHSVKLLDTSEAIAILASRRLVPEDGCFLVGFSEAFLTRGMRGLHTDADMNIAAAGVGVGVCDVKSTAVETCVCQSVQSGALSLAHAQQIANSNAITNGSISSQNHQNPVGCSPSLNYSEQSTIALALPSSPQKSQAITAPSASASTLQPYISTSGDDMSSILLNQRWKNVLLDAAIVRVLKKNTSIEHPAIKY